MSRAQNKTQLQSNQNTAILPDFMYHYYDALQPPPHLKRRASNHQIARPAGSRAQLGVSPHMCGSMLGGHEGVQLWHASIIKLGYAAL